VVADGNAKPDKRENARRTGAIQPASRLFPTHLPAKNSEKRYERNEWTREMTAYAEFVEGVSGHVVGFEVSVRYSQDVNAVCGQFFGCFFDVNLACHQVEDW
jgi:hypothetical protein